MTTTAPAVRSSAIWSRLARMMADCSAARRPASRRIRRTDGAGRPGTGEQAAEVRVSRYQDPLIDPSTLQDSRIRCRLHTKVPQVDSIVSGRLQAFGKERDRL